MEESETDVAENDYDTCVNIARGGPIYVPNMISPLTRVSEFESLVFNELEDLKEVINWDSVEVCDEDFSVDELKLITEEELADKAFEVAFKTDTVTEDDSSKHDDSRKEDSKQSKNRKRAYNQNQPLDGICREKVEALAKIREKQEEDKTAARLHSFNGSCKNERATSSEKTEKVVCLKSTLKSTSSAIKTSSLSICEHVPVLYPETILCVEVYNPRQSWKKNQEFLVLGRQFLTEVRDKIRCVTDEIMKKADEDSPSGYFLIEDVFYNDLREASAIDYSKPILNWMRDSKKDALEKWEFIISGGIRQKKKSVFDSHPESNLPQFTAAEMHKTRFCDLKFRLGAGYLYCHQGDCKHVLVIRDMRLVNPEDVQNRANYPLLTYHMKVRIRKCSVCNVYAAEKVTVDDKWAPENPCYFCKVCYYMLHYNNKSLLYDEFSVYDYHDE